VRLKTIWPFPEDPVARLAETAKRIVVPEMNLGQIAGEVRKAARGKEVVGLNKIGGGELITPEEVLEKLTEGSA
jgi:2-oxoglutarate ferredoxin oxidoreductase subunit alpha